ncbi:MAG: PstS family phosphate ABC transporter substrate-binding protein [Elusimicrobia bacterium]|nr:PstS family phosphate ABC transporter substrate-binding protein [Elusimicrobiota bacterium]
MKKISFYLLSCVLVLSFTVGCGKKSGDSIQIKGSDTMVNLVQAWSEEFSKENPGANMSVTGGGTGTGIASFISGSCDIVAASRQMEPKEIELAKRNGLEEKEFIVSLDGIAVVVNPKNPVGNLTIDQLRDIFTGKIQNWNEVGGNDAKIVLLSREINSGTHVFFKEHILRKGNPKGSEEFSPGALLMPSSQAIADEVAQNTNTIGYYGMGYISPKQKLVAVSKGPKMLFVLPSIETVQNNSYPISRPLYLYTKNNAPDTVSKFVDFTLSSKGQEIVKKLDFVPVK